MIRESGGVVKIKHHSKNGMNLIFNICYNAHCIKVLDGANHPVKRETGEIPVLPPQR